MSAPQHVYLIRCIGMQRADRIVITDVAHLFEWMKRYITQYGQIDLLYLEE